MGIKNLTIVTLLCFLTLNLHSQNIKAQESDEANLSDTLDQEPGGTELEQNGEPNSATNEAQPQNPTGEGNPQATSEEVIGAQDESGTVEALDTNGQPATEAPVKEENLGNRIMEMNSSNLNRDYYKEFIYDERDRRDPFIPIAPVRQTVQSEGAGDKTDGLMQFDVSQLVVSAIVWNSRKPKALIRDPLNNVYTVKEKDLIGRNNGYIESIREGEVVVIESREIRGGEKFFTTQILRVGR